MQHVFVILFLALSGTASMMQRSLWQPKKGDLVECRSLTAWISAKYVGMHDGMPLCELDGVRRPFQQVRKPQKSPERLVDAQAAPQYDKQAVPELDGHTSQVNPLRPNSDRRWWTEARWKKNQQYMHQDGDITDEPVFSGTKQMPQESIPAVDQGKYKWVLVLLVSSLTILICIGGLCFYEFRIKSEDNIA
eukprot:gnl/MRDRNA2_/MRDRNA2_114462_c0_seq1.p1 gnl/MRDRNA2_/MRDRNA2_114462_c0~~gnl/MRDRNA2_/MRDRNA2_114462_c0_seq1.p1  ORF type:complete len:191 (-),score=33.33 gnl/MRDRNA2_/MRDRNA2_114462_c0_seq1:35-607(-)